MHTPTANDLLVSAPPALTPTAETTPQLLENSCSANVHPGWDRLGPIIVGSIPPTTASYPLRRSNSRTASSSAGVHRAHRTASCVRGRKTPTSVEAYRDLLDPEVFPGAGESPLVTNIRHHSLREVLPQLLRCESAAWIEEWRADRETLERRAEVYPEGFSLIYDEESERVIGFSTAMLVDYKESMVNWNQITGDGGLGHHSEDAGFFYVVSLAVDPHDSGQGHGRRLIQQQVALGHALGKRVIIGSRVPSYSSNPDRSPEEAVAEDWEVRFYQKHGGFEVVKILPDFGDDPESLNYGVLMEAPRRGAARQQLGLPRRLRRPLGRADALRLR